MGGPSRVQLAASRSCELTVKESQVLGKKVSRGLDFRKLIFPENVFILNKTILRIKTARQTGGNGQGFFYRVIFHGFDGVNVCVCWKVRCTFPG